MHVCVTIVVRERETKKIRIIYNVSCHTKKRKTPVNKKKNEQKKHSFQNFSTLM